MPDELLKRQEDESDRSDQRVHHFAGDQLLGTPGNCLEHLLLQLPLAFGFGDEWIR
jgi:hypothetical protein